MNLTVLYEAGVGLTISWLFSATDGSFKKAATLGQLCACLCRVRDRFLGLWKMDV